MSRKPNESGAEMAQLSIRLPEQDYLAIGHAAFVNGVTTADEIRAAISRLLKELRSDPEFSTKEEARIRESRQALFGEGTDRTV
jgi:hypothetical protein